MESPLGAVTLATICVTAFTRGFISSSYQLITCIAGLAVAQPFRECALVVGGLYGYFLFGEMAGRGLFAKFMICALVMMLGILALSVFGEQKEK